MSLLRASDEAFQVHTGSTTSGPMLSASAIAVIGAHNAQAGSGAVFVFMRTGIIADTGSNLWMLQNSLFEPSKHPSSRASMGIAVATTYSSGTSISSSSTSVVEESKHSYGKGITLMIGTVENKLLAFFLSQDRSSPDFGVWKHTQTLVPPTSSSSGATDLFGQTLSLSDFALDDGRVLAVGASGTNGGTGLAFLYQKLLVQNTTGRNGWTGLVWQWEHAATLHPPAGELQPQSRYGSAVSVSGGRVAVGTCDATTNGAVYVFVARGVNITLASIAGSALSGNTGLIDNKYIAPAIWTFETQILPLESKGAKADGFGCALCLTATMTLVTQSNGNMNGKGQVGSIPGPTFYVRHTMAVGAKHLSTTSAYPFTVMGALRRMQGGVLTFVTPRPRADGATPQWQIGSVWNQGTQLVQWECNHGTFECDGSNTPTTESEFGRQVAMSPGVNGLGGGDGQGMQVIVGQPQTLISGLTFNPGITVTFEDSGDIGDNTYHFYAPVVPVGFVSLLLLVLLGGCLVPCTVGWYVRKGREKRLGYLHILNEHQLLQDIDVDPKERGGGVRFNRKRRESKGRGEVFDYTLDDDARNSGNGTMVHTNHSTVSLELSAQQIRSVPKKPTSAGNTVGDESARFRPKESKKEGGVTTLRVADPITRLDTSNSSFSSSKDWSEGGIIEGASKHRSKPLDTRRGVFQYEEDSELDDGGDEGEGARRTEGIRASAAATDTGSTANAGNTDCTGIHSTILTFPQSTLYTDFMGSTCVAMCAYGFMYVR